MQGGERDLGGADQEQLVALDLVDHLPLAGEEPGPVERPLADEHRRDDRLEALGADHLDGEADQRQLDQHEVAEQVGEARARGGGRLLDLDPAVARGRGRGGRGPRSRSSARSPTSRRTTASSSVSPSGRVRVGRLGSVAASASRRASTSVSSASSALSSAETARIRAITSLGVAARALRRRDRVGGRVLAARAGPRPRAAARGGGRRARAARRAPSAPRRASAARAGAGSSRIARRSSTSAQPAAAGLLADWSPPACPAAAGVDLGARVLGDELGDRLGLVADDDVLGHDRPREAAVADRVEDVVDVSVRSSRFGPWLRGARGWRNPGCRRRQRVAARAALGEEHGAVVGRVVVATRIPRCRRRRGPALPRLRL